MGTVVDFLPRYRAARLRAFVWRHELSVAGKVALAFGMAAVTGLCAQIRIPLAFTPVPVTGQVFAVLLAGVLLGRGYAGLSQVIYLGLGAAGLPWFADCTAGSGVLSGVTGGYLVGFVLAAELIAFASNRYVWARRLWPQFCLMMFGVGAIYLCGALQFSLVMRTGLAGTLRMAVMPFILVDAAKAVLAASLSTALLPKTSFNGEIDAPGH